MGRPKKEPISRRRFLRGIRYAPTLLLPAPLQRFAFWHSAAAKAGLPLAVPEFQPVTQARFVPHYPAAAPLEDVLRLVPPGSDEFVDEKYAWEIGGALQEWSQALRTQAPALAISGKFLSNSLQFSSLQKPEEKVLRSGYGIEIKRRKFAGSLSGGADRFAAELKEYFAAFSSIKTAEFQITAIAEAPAAPSALDVQIRYEIGGATRDGSREQRIGHWQTQWRYDETSGWQALRWEAREETISRARQPIFVDVGSPAFGQIDSYRLQLLHGVDHWRTVLDGACGIDVYGNNGVAAGDFDGDGFDDLYICQPAGLPNRLYRNRGDGTFEDVTAKARVDVLDATACALFADFDNRGLQDLLVVTGSGPLLFLNQGDGTFARKRDAFHFAKPPQGTFTHAAIADYDSDGRLDIYFCLYSYYLGLDQYHYPAPYYDARNGPPNFLMRNEGNATFRDVTMAAGLNVDNDRYSFACAWGDFDSSGRPSLYVANDFGRANLYLNNGDGTFASAASEAGVDNPGAGMSTCWCDFDNDGRQDIYVANMWSAAGLRVSSQKQFQPGDGENTLGFYRQHARGNSLYRNLGHGKFRNVASDVGAGMGRWAWSSDAWDFDHDGYSDLYIANGYISGPDVEELGSFFWRQVVAKSPDTASPSSRYEQGWNAINELIRSDRSWSGRERNVFYANHGDGTFSEISGVAAMDFMDDSRAFALADLDHDGRLEVVLKNRSAPQIRILRNAMKEIGNRVSFRLRGEKSNRDAIGAAVTVEAGTLRQTKYLQAGSGFLSQHTKELFFGVGKYEGTVRAMVHWPSGLRQTFERVPVNSRIQIREGAEQFATYPFADAPGVYAQRSQPASVGAVMASTETWLIEPLPAPEFSLAEVGGKSLSLPQLRGSAALLVFWAGAASESLEQLRRLQKVYSGLQASGLRVVALNIDGEESGRAAVQSAAGQKFSFPVLLASPEIAGVYNILYRYMFDRRRDLSVPVTLLLDKEGRIVKLYQGMVNTESIMKDAVLIPSNEADRVQRALPFPGTLHNGKFERNDFTYGVALFQRGYLDQAANSFQAVIAAKPNEPEAYYNLGTLYLRRNSLDQARTFLEQSVKLRPTYPEALNNLGMVAAQQNKAEDAIDYFQRALQQRPDYATALLNVGNVYRRQGNFGEAEKALNHAAKLEPENAEVYYNLGMLYAGQEQLPVAAQYLQKAVQLRPNYADALNNLGVFFVRQERYPDAESEFQSCIRVAPQFDQAYLNLARLYVLLKEKEKARQTLEALLQQQPQHKIARQALEMLN